MHILPLCGCSGSQQSEGLCPAVCSHPFSFAFSVSQLPSYFIYNIGRNSALPWLILIHGSILTPRLQCYSLLDFISFLTLVPPSVTKYFLPLWWGVYILCNGAFSKWSFVKMIVYIFPFNISLHHTDSAHLLAKPGFFTECFIGTFRGPLSRSLFPVVFVSPHQPNMPFFFFLLVWRDFQRFLSPSEG